ncbi:MAG: hypothetical protein J5999_03070 [Oscillospiraceae bacterium]|nr:hypothetical protein [Oscillospiraceae bacterium]
MNSTIKRTAAFCAAFVMTGTMLTACGTSGTDTNNTTDQTTQPITAAAATGQQHPQQTPQADCPAASRSSTTEPTVTRTAL